MYNKNQEIKPFDSKIWLSSPTMHGEELTYMTKAFETNWMSTVGSNIDEAEYHIQKLIGTKYSVGLSSCTAALHLSIKLAGEKLYGKPKLGKGALDGHKVFCSDMTFVAVANPIVYENGIPIFIDTEKDTWNMDPEALEKAFSLYPDVKLVCLSHLYGVPAKINEIRDICKKHQALLIEDAAESLGATYKNKQTGSFGDYGVVSFNGNKIITGSSGGCFVTDDEEDFQKIRKWSTQSREKSQWYQHEDIGFNYRMSNVVAGVICGQFPYLQEHIQRKKEIYNRYKEGLNGIPVSMNPFDRQNSEPNYWLSAILIQEEYMCQQQRNNLEATYKKEYKKSCPTEILEALSDINAEGRPIWKPMHSQPLYKEAYFVKKDQEDVGEDIFRRGLCLPSDIKMTNDQQDRIIEVIRKCFE